MPRGASDGAPRGEDAMKLSRIHRPSVAWEASRQESELVREFADQCQGLVDDNCRDPATALIALTDALPRIDNVAARAAIERVVAKVLLRVSLTNTRGEARRALVDMVCRICNDRVPGGREPSKTVEENGGWRVDTIVPRGPSTLTPHQIRIVSKALHTIRLYAYRHSFTLQCLATAVGVSTFHLDRLLKAHTGASFVAHRTAVRLERAKALLVCSTFSIKEVSAAVGFNSVGAFDRAFKRACGSQPGQWRNQRLCERQVAISPGAVP